MTKDVLDQKRVKIITKVLLGTSLAVVIFILLVGMLKKLQVPNSLHEAHLEGRSWNADEVMLAKRVTYRQLSSLAAALDDAHRKGDSALIWQIMPESTRVLGAWNDQADDVKQQGRNCILSALHLSNGLSSVAAGSGWARGRFDAALQDCKP